MKYKTKKANFCEFDEEEREEIYNRDFHRCVYCGSNSFLGIAHTYISRSHGGKGCKENGVLLCQKCHHALDNGMDLELKLEIRKYIRDYLESYYGEPDLDTLKYDKYKV